MYDLKVNTTKEEEVEMLSSFSHLYDLFRQYRPFQPFWPLVSSVALLMASAAVIFSSFWSTSDPSWLSISRLRADVFPPGTDIMQRVAMAIAIAIAEANETR